MTADAQRLTDQKGTWSEPGSCGTAGINSTFFKDEHGEHKETDDMHFLKIKNGYFSFIIEVPK
jgi:hypothetical protein